MTERLGIGWYSKATYGNFTERPLPTQLHIFLDHLIGLLATLRRRFQVAIKLGNISRTYLCSHLPYFEGFYLTNTGNIFANLSRQYDFFTNAVSLVNSSTTLTNSLFSSLKNSNSCIINAVQTESTSADPAYTLYFTLLLKLFV
jgi:hypothetical protein